MSVFFADNSCELDSQIIEKYKINIIHMPCMLDGKDYIAKTECEKTAFFREMQGGAEASTSCLNPQNYIDYARRVFAESYTCRDRTTETLTYED